MTDTSRLRKEAAYYSTCKALSIYGVRKGGVSNQEFPEMKNHVAPAWLPPAQGFRAMTSRRSSCPRRQVQQKIENRKSKILSHKLSRHICKVVSKCFIGSIPCHPAGMRRGGYEQR